MRGWRKRTALVGFVKQKPTSASITAMRPASCAASFAALQSRARTFQGRRETSSKASAYVMHFQRIGAKRKACTLSEGAAAPKEEPGPFAAGINSSQVRQRPVLCHRRPRESLRTRFRV
jgi:hypothetical protein